MSMKPPATLLLLGATALVTFAQSSENAQFKAQQEALKREAEQQQAVIQADINRNPNGKNAILARENAAKEEVRVAAAKAAELKAQAAAEADKKTAETAAAEKAKKEIADWNAAAPARAQAEAAKKAAVEKWRSSGKAGPSIIINRKSDGSANVMVDGKLSSFKTVAEAEAFVEATRRASEGTLTY